jgi:hypothetical protein
MQISIIGWHTTYELWRESPELKGGNSNKKYRVEVEREKKIAFKS